jgi:hypothetical protein
MADILWIRLYFVKKGEGIIENKTIKNDIVPFNFI